MVPCIINNLTNMDEVVIIELVYDYLSKMIFEPTMTLKFLVSYTLS